MQDGHSVEHVEVDHAWVQACDLLERRDRSVDAASRGLLGAFVHGEEHHPPMHDRGLGCERRAVGLPARNKFVQVRLNGMGLVRGHSSVGDMNPNPG